MKELGFTPVKTVTKVARKVIEPGAPGAVSRSTIPAESRAYTGGLLRGPSQGPGSGKQAQVLSVRRGVPEKQKMVTDTVESISWKAPANLKPLIGKMGIKNIGEARVLVNNISDLSKGLDKGFRISDIDRLRNSLGEAGFSLPNSPAGRQLSILSKEMRETYRQSIAAGLDNKVEADAFNAHMTDYGAIMENIDTLKSALNSDSSAKAIVSNFVRLWPYCNTFHFFNCCCHFFCF